MGVACGLCGGERKCVQGIGVEPWTKKNHFKDLGPEGKIILK